MSNPLASTAVSDARIAGVFGRVVCGTVVTSRTAGQPAIGIFDGDGFLGLTDVVLDDDGGLATNESRWKFSLRLPLEIYDGLPHELRPQFVYGDEAAFHGAGVLFVGDPNLRLPAKKRIRNVAGAARTAAPEELLATPALPVPRPRAVLELADRYGELIADAAIVPSGPTFIWLGVIDWDFRIQRPQHLATNLADLGSRVLYVSIVFEPADEKGRFRIIKSPHPGVFEMRLRLLGDLPKNIYRVFESRQIAEMLAALDEMMHVLHIAEPVCVVEYPSWYPVASGIPGATVVHDCLDFVGGFSDTPPAVIALEEHLVRDADLLFAASEPLMDHVGKHRPAVLIQNAADVELFGTAGDAESSSGRRPIIGYFGAIAEWYAMDWIVHCARAHPLWQFVLIGSTYGCDMGDVESLTNVRLLGERPYHELPAHLSHFDVALIPFQLNDLARYTNPVKLYEYMAGGKPVVSSAMPEVIEATDFAYVAHDAREFECQIEKALAEDSPSLRIRRRRWAQQHTWAARAMDVSERVKGAWPTVSVVILSYDNWLLTRACIESVLKFSDYQNLELLVVDNGSHDETPERLTRLQQQDPRVHVILNEDNLGFAAGNNVGIAAASGAHVILLNNDTYVTRGWIRDLIRPLQQDPQIGLTVPVTNDIGNEQKIAITYDNMQQMAVNAQRFVRQHTRRRFETHTVAFFCVAIRREVIATVGLLDEAYGLGFFEDDDYCRRVEEAGYRIVIVDDVFVHHHLSASFDALGADRRRAQMTNNKAIYEAKWGEWTPHKYRDAPGFG